MPKPDWRSSSAYDHIRKINASGLAWEFLRRNPDYRRDYRRYRHIVDQTEIAVALRRWGVRFRGRPGPPGDREARLLVPGHRTRRPDALRCAA